MTMTSDIPMDVISFVEVRGLFGRFDHSINLSNDEKISIITAPNGYGKTILLRMIDSVFNMRFSFFTSIAFDNIRIGLVSGRRILIYNDPNDLIDEDAGRSRRRVTIRTVGFGFDDKSYDISSIGGSADLEFIERRLPIQRVGPDSWADISTDERFSTASVVDLYSDHLPARLVEMFKVPSWLKKVTDTVDVHFIETQRLLSLEEREELRARSRARHAPPPSVVEKDARDLANRISRLLQDYANEAQKLDQTFPKRIIENKPGARMSETDIRDALQNLSEKRDQLVSVGLLSQALTEPIQPSDIFDNETIQRILAVYIEDTKKKLEIFDSTYARIRLFKEVLNEHFLFKSVEIDADRGITCVDKDSGEKIPLSELSSGEQHELVLIYDLLFKVESGSTILIDEPELSLHVAWQKRFISDLEKVQKLNNMNVIIATHSPQIIHDRWDQVQELALFDEE